MTYIEEHLADNISVESLAGVAHFHPHYFIRYFRRLTGRSPETTSPTPGSPGRAAFCRRTNGRFRRSRA